MNPARKPVIAIAGLGCENSTFSPACTRAVDFHVKCGHEVFKQYAFLDSSTTPGAAADSYGTLFGSAIPGGKVTNEAFQELAGELITRLQDLISSTHIDGLWFSTHGAMYVERWKAIEAELLRRIRAVIGSDVVVSASDGSEWQCFA